MEEAENNAKFQNYDNRRNEDNSQFPSKGNSNNGNHNAQQKRNKGGAHNYNNDKKNQKNQNYKKGNNDNRISNKSNSEGNSGQFKGNKQGMNQRQNDAFSGQNMGGNMMNSEMPMDNSGGFYPTVGMNVQFRPNPMVGFMQPTGFLPNPGFYMPQTQMFNTGGYNQVYGYPPQGFPYKMG